MTSSRTRPTPWRITRWLVALVVLNLLWRTLRYVLGFPIWGDESFLAVSLITRDWLELFQGLEYPGSQVAPLLFLWMERLAGCVFGWSELALRAGPFLAGIGSMIVFAMLAPRAIGRHGGLVAIAIFAASYYPVRHAAEIKPYSTDLFVAVVLLFIAVPLAQGRGPRGRWGALAAVSSVAVWSSYPSVFTIGGIFTVLALIALMARDRSAFVRTVVTAIPSLLSFLVMWAVFGANQSSASSLTDSDHWAFTFPPIMEPWRLPLWFIDVHTGLMFAYPNGGNHGGSAATFVFFLLGAVVLWRRSGGRDRPVLLMLLSPLAFMFIAAALHRYPYGGSARVALHMAPAICMLFACGLLAVLRHFLDPVRLRNAIPIVLIVFCAFIAIGAYRDVQEPYKKFSDFENRRLIAEWGETSPPDGQWIIFGTPDGQPQTINMLDWGGTVARLRFNILRYVEVPVHWDVGADDLDDLPRVPTRFVVFHDNHWAFPQPALDAYLPHLIARFGEPVVETFPMQDGGEKIISYLFEPKRDVVDRRE